VNKPPKKKTRLLSRRRFLGAAGLGTAAFAYRGCLGYASLDDWQGEVLSSRQASILLSVANALLPPAADEGAFKEVPIRVDRFLRGLPTAFLREVNVLFYAVEHSTTILTARWHRCSELPLEDREAFLTELSQRKGLQGLLYKGIRDLCMLGYYQQQKVWPSMGYTGPMVGPPRPEYRYGWMKAKDGALPQTLVKDS
jgi:hypothetical protein